MAFNATNATNESANGVSRGGIIEEGGKFYAVLDAETFPLSAGPLERDPVELNKPAYWQQTILVHNDGSTRTGSINLLSVLPTDLVPLLHSVRVMTIPEQALLAETAFFPLSLDSGEQRRLLAVYETEPARGTLSCEGRTLKHLLPPDASILKTTLEQTTVLGDACTLSITYPSSRYAPFTVPLPPGVRDVFLDGKPVPPSDTVKII
ncbi:hypothetical protein D6789_00200 [Candidatus Woesearchaeota archaeon]|nr:MAG: hypothetical protein D6789_00200 [Candidatus Woesearchaeota archaeon]